MKKIVGVGPVKALAVYLCLLLGLVTGCSKKAAEPAASSSPAEPAAAAPAAPAQNAEAPAPPPSGPVLDSSRWSAMPSRR